MNKADFKGLTLNETMAKFQSVDENEADRLHTTEVVLNKVTSLLKDNGANVDKPETRDSICIMMARWGFSYSATYKLQHNL